MKMRISKTFLTEKNFFLRYKNGFPFTVPFRGSPLCELSCDPSNNLAELRIFINPKENLKINKKEIFLKYDSSKKKPSILISLKKSALVKEFYAICIKIIENFQINKFNPKKAIFSVFSNFDELLKEKRDISNETIIGLWGELFIILEYLKNKKSDRIIKEWFGPLDEEHDFVSAKSDYEVKTTTLERRIHQISSFTQLQAKKGRPLFLLSVQVTSGSVKSGYSISTLIKEIHKAIKKQTIRDVFNQKLKEYNVKEILSEKINQKYILRNEIRLIPINKDFPKITPDCLKNSKKNLNRINKVSYNVNVEGYGNVFSKKSYV